MSVHSNRREHWGLRCAHSANWAGCNQIIIIINRSLSLSTRVNAQMHGTRRQRLCYVVNQFWIYTQSHIGAARRPTNGFRVCVWRVCARARARAHAKMQFVDETAATARRSISHFVFIFRFIARIASYFLFDCHFAVHRLLLGTHFNHSLTHTRMPFRPSRSSVAVIFGMRAT